MTTTGSETVYPGTAVTSGVVIGPIYTPPEVSRSGPPTVPFEDALTQAQSQIEQLIANVDEAAGDILEFQLALLEDEDLLDPIRQDIADGTPSDTAWIAAMDREIAEYRDGGDATFAARADDLTDLRDRVSNALHGGGDVDREIPNGAILVAADLTPSGFLSLDWARLAGAVTAGGSATSHVSILARARGVPLMVGAKWQDLPPIGHPAVLDLGHATLTVDPGADTLAQAESTIRQNQDSARIIAGVIDQPAITRDGTPVGILMNIDAPAILDAVSPQSCDGVGLTRTEFLFQNGIPDEEQQLAFYRQLMRWADGRPVTIRTLDAGGDKPIPGVTVDGEANPFLGVRGVRLSLRQPDLFRVQLRALLRAAPDGDMKVMIPMITAPWELTAVRELLTAEYQAMQAAGIACAMPELGMMVEVPAAALSADDFDADFYSIGSNDLIQYTTASARDNPDVANLADPKSSAVLALIKATVDAGARRNVPVSLCGDMASSPDAVRSLLDQGLRWLSCAPAQIGPVKYALAQIDLDREDS